MHRCNSHRVSPVCTPIPLEGGIVPPEGGSPKSKHLYSDDFYDFSGDFSPEIMAETTSDQYQRAGQLGLCPAPRYMTFAGVFPGRNREKSYRPNLTFVTFGDFGVTFGPFLAGGAKNE